MSMLDFNQLSLRPIRDSDLPFLYRLYASTRELEMSLVTDWTPECKRAFVQQQFQAQHLHYTTQYANARLALLLLADKAIGRFYVQRNTDSIQLMEITLLPEWRGLGIGTFLIKQLISEAQASHCQLALYVEPYNPALHLYERLGFVSTHAHGAYYHLQWQALPPTDLPSAIIRASI